LPARRILEIAPGRGRWTQFLLRQCDEYFGVDISEKCIEFCRRRFAAESRARFFANDGQSLRMVADDSIDFVVSLDSLVHVELDVLREYIWQTAQKLTSVGVAFIHHSNGAGDGVDAAEAQAHSRALSVSATIVKELAEDCGCRVLIQEELNWAGATLIDCWTTFCRTGIHDDHPYQLLRNDAFPFELQHIRRFLNPYNLK
jgi:cyclopropane fatty-acyl-phospholipid synthase-like methyltransferase